MKKAFGRIKTVTAPANHLDDFFGGLSSLQTNKSHRVLLTILVLNRF